MVVYAKSRCFLKADTESRHLSVILVAWRRNPTRTRRRRDFLNSCGSSLDRNTLGSDDGNGAISLVREIDQKMPKLAGNHRKSKWQCNSWCCDILCTNWYRIKILWNVSFHESLEPNFPTISYINISGTMWTLFKSTINWSLNLIWLETLYSNEKTYLTSYN